MQYICIFCVVTQAALKRQKKEKVCKTTNLECWLHDEDVQLEQSELLELEGRLEWTVEITVVDLEAGQDFYLAELVLACLKTCLKKELNNLN